MSEESVVKRKRGVLRTGITKTLNLIETELMKSEYVSDTLEELVVKLEDKFETLKKLDNDIELLLKPDEIEEEVKCSEEYREKIITWLFRARKQIYKTQNPTVMNFDKRNGNDMDHNESKTEVCRNNNFVRVKLPKMTIPTFKGDVSQWLTFWNAFETSVDKNESLDEVDKFNYLKAHLGSTALTTVEGFAISPQNYVKAVDLLKDRFARTEDLINAHLKIIMHLPKLKGSHDINEFRNLFDTCQTQIRSLESLGVDSGSFGTLLCPLILQSLSRDLVLEFNKTFNKGYELKDIVDFMSQQLTARERSNTYSDHAESSSSSSSKKHNSGFSSSKGMKRSTAADLISSGITENKLCVFCDDQHSSATCEFVQHTDMEKKKAILKKKGACFRCLKRNHISRFCKAAVKCSFCGKRHLDVMCCTSANSNNEQDLHQQREAETLSNYSSTNEVYLQTMVVYINEKERKELIRIIIDTGSQRSYITKKIAERMQLVCKGNETVNHGLFGGIEKAEKHKLYQVTLFSVDKEYSCTFEVMDQEKICGNIPKVRDSRIISELRRLEIRYSDFEINEKVCFQPNEIQLLIGADVAGKLLTGGVKDLYDNLVAINTKLGWTVMGKTKHSETTRNNSLLILSLHAINSTLSDLWSLDSLGINDPAKEKSKLETQTLALEHFEDTLEIEESGRYKVCLPWIDGHLPLNSNQSLAKKRLKHTVQSLKKTGKLEAYQDVLYDWESEGIIERVPSEFSNVLDSTSKVHYLAHRAVIKELSTTKIRPVYDASATTRNSVSLNDCIEKGPNLIELIPAVLNRFRWGKIGVTADIRKAFLQISLQERDRDFLRFLWWEDGDCNRTIIYRHCRVVFGVSCSPFLLAAVLNHLLDRAPTEKKDLAKKLKKSMYVDNCVASVDSEEELKYFRIESKNLMASAKFDLRGWVCNKDAVEENYGELNSLIPEDPNISLLGLTWNTEEDVLSCNFLETEEPEGVTKRKILSIAHRVFDPVGFTCPFTLIPKLLLQECWKLETTWDSNLPEDIVRKFERWKSQLPLLKNIKIPRRLSNLDLKEAVLTLHIFCDASKSSYAACIFLRAEKDNKVTCQLVQAKTRVAPLKPISIPRMELLACCIGARLAASVKRDLYMEEITSFYWSDSMDVLFWIKKAGPWAVFVANRVKEIRELSSADEWNYVPGIMNPADLPSRGCSAKSLIEDSWWEGPSWLRDKPSIWPKVSLVPDENIVNSEKKRIIVSAIDEIKTKYYHNMFSYKKIIRVTAWIWRFVVNAGHSRESSHEPFLTTKEISRAEDTILRCIQKEAFPEGIKDQRLISLRPVVDKNGLIHVETQVFMRKDTETFRLPVLLPSNHSLVEKLISFEHQKLHHAGVLTLMSNLREKYWILKCRKTVSKVVGRCIRCRRFLSRPIDVKAPCLPEDRVRDAAVFEVTGIDLAGPLILKEGQKAWIVLFSCAIYRAIHLELVTSISTNAFTQALRRFISRRGRPSVIYSDNGTNFRGTHADLKKIKWEKIQADSTLQSITWKFIPPSSPWWGGFWERLIQMVKVTLRKTLGLASLNYEEMNSILCETECLVNSRPLTYLSEDINDLVAITPSMFLHEIKQIGVPDLDEMDRKKLEKRVS